MGGEVEKMVSMFQAKAIVSSIRGNRVSLDRGERFGLAMRGSEERIRPWGFLLLSPPPPPCCCYCWCRVCVCVCVLSRGQLGPF